MRYKDHFLCLKNPKQVRLDHEIKGFCLLQWKFCTPRQHKCMQVSFCRHVQLTNGICLPSMMSPFLNNCIGCNHSKCECDHLAALFFSKASAALMLKLKYTELKLNHQSVRVKITDTLMQTRLTKWFHNSVPEVAGLRTTLCYWNQTMCSRDSPLVFMFLFNPKSSC